jgi:hypothetical protein
LKSPGLFDRVVILGASVSAGEKAPSPGLLLARHMATPEEQIFTFAQGGAASDRHRGFLDNIAALRPTLIVALDLFYHDFKASLFLTESRKQYLRDYVASLHNTGALVVLGSIPDLVLLRHEHVNRYLDQLAGEFPNLLLVDVQRQLDALDDGMAVRIGREKVVLKHQDVFADRVHPNRLGSTLMANHILDLLRDRLPSRVELREAAPLPIDVARPAMNSELP